MSQRCYSCGRETVYGAPLFHFAGCEAAQSWIPYTVPMQWNGLPEVPGAEALILQLPTDHDGRNSWLINHGRSEEAARLRAEWEGRET